KSQRLKELLSLMVNSILCRSHSSNTEPSNADFAPLAWSSWEKPCWTKTRNLRRKRFANIFVVISAGVRDIRRSSGRSRIALRVTKMHSAKRIASQYEDQLVADSGTLQACWYVSMSCVLVGFSPCAQPFALCGSYS